MNSQCLICLRSTKGQTGYHAACGKALFGSTLVPKITLEDGMVLTAGLAMAGKTSLSGAQKKISVRVSGDRSTLQVATSGGRYILKPPNDVYRNLPEVEHTTMQLAKVSGIDVAINGLIKLDDGRFAYLTQRFDRVSDGSKIRQEDFCQLAMMRPSQKYKGSAELCFRIIKQFASEPGVGVRQLFNQLLFSWWVGNGDLHLKNLSLLVDAKGIVKLTPAYDLVCTRLVIPDDNDLAMPMCGRNQKIRRATWLKLADYAGIPRKAAERVMANQVNALSKSIETIEHSFIDTNMKSQLKELLVAQTEILADLGADDSELPP